MRTTMKKLADVAISVIVAAITIWLLMHRG